MPEPKLQHDAAITCFVIEECTAPKCRNRQAGRLSLALKVRFALWIAVKIIYSLRSVHRDPLRAGSQIELKVQFTDLENIAFVENLLVHATHRDHSRVQPTAC